MEVDNASPFAFALGNKFPKPKVLALSGELGLGHLIRALNGLVLALSARDQSSQNVRDDKA